MDAETLVREMATTESEFRRTLDCAFPDGVSGNAGLLHVRQGDAAMEITVRSLPPRNIALLQLPRIEVCIRFAAGSAEQRQALLMRLDRAMQRGGG